VSILVSLPFSLVTRDESDDPSDNNEIFFSRKIEHERFEDLSQREMTNMYTNSTHNIDKQTKNLSLSNTNSNSVSFSSSHSLMVTITGIEKLYYPRNAKKKS